MRIAVVDDEKVFRSKICDMIYSFYSQSDVVCSQFENGKALLDSYLSGKNFDVIFLDIEMPVLDGMETARKVREFSGDVLIIFLTSHTDMAVDGYEVGAFRFLPKSSPKSKLEKALTDIEKHISKSKRIILKTALQEYVVMPESIIYAESNNNNVIFITNDSRYSVRMKLSAAFEMLNDAKPVFVKIHRCSVVNLAHICSYTNKEVYMDNGEVIPISRSFSENFRSRMFSYIKHSAI